VLVTAVLKTRTDLLLAGEFAGRVLTVMDGADQPFANCDELIGVLVASASSAAPAMSRAAALTARQREVLDLVATGSTNAEIAALLGLSSGTVRKHLESAYRALGARNRAEAVSHVVR
jgi:DNA-binding CsgD family transcriptional regulator